MSEEKFMLLGSKRIRRMKPMTDKQTALFPGSDKPDTFNVLRGLERAEIEPLALKIIGAIDPYCTKVEVAGSIRRRKDTVNDIDIVVLPKTHSWIKLLKEIRRRFDAVTEKQGAKLATLYVPFVSKQGHVQVDLYRATKKTWGILLLIRTGSAKHNIYLASLAMRKGYRLAYSKGLLDEKGEVVASKTERDVFEALGLDYIQPLDREVKGE
jgi:DNA polymerase (family 10)